MLSKSSFTLPRTSVIFSIGMTEKQYDIGKTTTRISNDKQTTNAPSVKRSCDNRHYKQYDKLMAEEHAPPLYYTNPFKQLAR